ncbi:MAG: nucleotidyltransferase domain-containing protein, partial [Campylobacterota bacterium]|nr:nucleotidyltransferase domain-containing protein [Campylobacterota bacterium]
MIEAVKTIPKYKDITGKYKAQNILMVNDIKEYISTLNNKNILSCYLFGSYSKNRANLFSDIDILLIFDEIKYEAVQNVISAYKEFFLNQGYICNPIYSYEKYLSNDSNILIRQYVKSGILLFGSKPNLPYESNEELKQKEYEDYWRANYLRKVDQLKLIFDQNDYMGDYGLLEWQYIYLVIYWYAKAELTLVNKQYSLNEYTLHYIYQNLLNTDLDKKEIDLLYLADRYRSAF